MSTQDPPQRLVGGRYRLRTVLGQGSMGTVWAAYDEHLHRPVAVKQVRLDPGIPQREADELRERTLREARAIAVVSHPNVITLHDVVREDGEPFVVMEFLPATSLAQILRANGPLDATQAAVVGDAIAAGLQAAHEAGITHRDVKPGNVLVTADGRVKLTDFGIARNVAERTLTRTGIMLGSPAYIAPEVASGSEVSPDADLWGLGATLWAAVEGRAPYDPEGAVLDIVTEVVHGEIPEPTVDGPLREVITALMVRDPAARMSLRTVRERLHELQPMPGTAVFADLRTDLPHSPDPTLAETTDPTAPAIAAPADPVSSASAPLAPVPGPLPFIEPDEPRGRSPWAAVVAVVAAVVLFAGAAAGGFALTRFVGGQPVRPLSHAQASQASAPVRDVEIRTADASTLAGEQGGGFSLPVPSDWVKFVEQRVTKTLPNSTRVHWVAPDGTSELVVERFPVFYPKHTADEYLTVLARRAPGYRLVGTTPIDGSTDPEPGVQVTYRTVDVADDAPGRPATTDVNRATFANVLPIGTDLWVVSLTVPIEQEDSGKRGLFTRTVPEFRATG
ncbi:serine/threonine protein kinase [Alloactinosynnema sp. L-07]|uniref:serine/threonine-protein kinase n=1 Tax=Alloactinosynnema sp. L-07 TaxID=1653480 RepID=UPI00065EF612|nr:serine/threonine-protein kinase [Alloactinosynnema sp. L-07]CRK59812.1 serine/threonine protein kinase [Alloactinosynnema sp. L-07]